MNKELCYNFGNIFISIDTAKNDEPCVVLGEKIAEPPANVRIVFSSHNECVVDIFIKLINKINTLEAENERLKNTLKQFNNNTCFLEPSKLTDVDLEILKRKGLVIGIDLAEDPKE